MDDSNSISKENMNIYEPFTECRHLPSSLTHFETLFIILVQIMLFITYLLIITYIWMLKVREKAQNYLHALPNRKMIQYMKKQRKSPFKLSTNSEIKNNNDDNNED